MANPANKVFAYAATTITMRKDAFNFELFRAVDNYWLMRGNAVPTTMMGAQQREVEHVVYAA